MNIVQSFWSCKQEDLLQLKAGWLGPEYNIMSWVLSCLQLKRFYPSVTLYADDTSARLLIDTLQLPYDNVVCELNQLDHYHPELWALPKIYAYSKQTSPFIHVDGDVFIYDYFNSKISGGELIAQNMESSTTYYEEIMTSLEAGLSYFPQQILTERGHNARVVAYNAGILGGNDVEFFQRYCDEAFRFVDKNVHDLSKIRPGNFNMFFEQYLFYCCAKQERKQVSVLIEDVIPDNEYKDLGEFEDVPHLKKYLHLLGPYKRYENVCLQMANRLRADYPEYYYRVIELFKRKGLSLGHDYYRFEKDILNESLLEKHHAVRNQYSSNEVTRSEGTETYSPVDRNLIVYREFWYNKAIEVLTTTGVGIPPERTRKDSIGQIVEFERYLEHVVTKNFSRISRDYLLGRDISNTGYFQYVFGDPDSIAEKMVVGDELVTITDQEFDWMILDLPASDDYLRLFTKTPEKTRILIVPECHQKGYSLASVDELDCLILDHLREQKKIGNLVTELESHFDADDIAESRQEFQTLVLGRIKMAIRNKSVKVLIPVEV